MNNPKKPEEVWPVAAEPATWSGDAIHVWSASLVIGDALRRRLWTWLSDEERNRATRFYFDHDRVRFIACRGRLRAMLATYLEKAPGEIEFQYGAHGKPEVRSRGAPPLFFNVSHSQDLALFAFRRGGEVGVDVERLRSVSEAEAIARRYFTAREWATLSESPLEERTAAFFRCWTRKEALLKAVGVGLSCPLNEVEVTLRSDELPKFLSLPPRESSAAGFWRLEHLAPAVGYLGALAATDASESLVCQSWIDIADA